MNVSQVRIVLRGDIRRDWKQTNERDRKIKCEAIMSIKLELPEITELKPRIVVVGVGGAGGNAINNMIASGLDGVEFVVANTDADR